MDKKPNVRERLPGGSVASALRTLYYDVAEIVAPAPLECLMEIADPSRVLFGSDFPFSRHRNPVQDVKDTIAGLAAFDGWDHATRRGVEHDNALKLFPRLAQAITRTSA
jgi:predicted TIM-barrel fold metal-dependent hydrolase